ncbi:hypothetical protein [Marinobacter halotolerans]|uniref:hypothetical protein n=1 Tax=Marinobacter halotolerans TaxID=1569211 RepID=UPI0012464FCE|nr:hypothetical protein [Marinobacter halotolerans]
MLNKCFYDIPICLAIACLPSLVLAQPVVSGMEGTVADGQTLTISGQGFGEFNGRIVSWDDFENQAIGNTVHGSKSKIGAGWSTQFGYQGDAIVFDNTHSVSGNKSVKIEWGLEPGSTMKGFGWSNQGPITNIYISYWRFMQGDYSAADGDNHKQFYLFGTNDGWPQFMPLIPARQTYWGIYNNSGQFSSRASGIREKNTENWVYSNTINEFQRWEWHIELNAPADAYNDSVRGWMDGVLGFNFDDYRTGRVDGAFDDFRLGHMAMGFMDTAKAWFDDLYVATTPARVEICAVDVWENCGKTKVLQVVDPAKWSPSTITIEIRGSERFSGQNGFAYVVDSEGNVSEPYSLRSGVAPQPPSALKVN